MRGIGLAMLLLLAACNGNQIQTSSGTQFREARPDYDPKKGTEIDQAVDRAANVEPLLRFPARIGLARVQFGHLAPVPPLEADAWIAFAQEHASMGSFVPISPLIAELADPGTANSPARNVVAQARLAAARQHVDAVLLYTVAGDYKDNGSPLSLLDLTIVGAYLVPSRSVQGQAVAQALLLDTRNGYPYGTANATATERDFVPSIGSSDRTRDLATKAEVAAVQKLTVEVGTMATRLRTELDEKELATLRAKVAAQPAHAIKRRHLPSQT